MFTKKSLACISILCTLALVGCTPTTSSSKPSSSPSSTVLNVPSLGDALASGGKLGGKISGEVVPRPPDVHDNVKKKYDKIPAKTIEYINYPNFSNDNYAPELMEYEQTKSYGDDNKYTATDIAWLDGKLLITDEENNRVLLQDPETGEVEIKATAGNGPGEFLNPRGIDVSSDGMVYIVDAGNDRVQVFDKKLNYKREVDLKDKDRKESYVPSLLDVAVDSSGYMFVTIGGTSADERVIYQISPDHKAGDKFQKWGDDYSGPACSDGEYIYTMNLSNDIGGGTYTSEISDVIQWKNGEIVERYRLPIRYAPGGFFVTDGMIYANRFAARSVDRFDYVAGKSDIMYSIHQVPEDYKKWNVKFSGMCPDDKGNIYLIKEDQTFSGVTEITKPGGYIVKLSPKKK